MASYFVSSHGVNIAYLDKEDCDKLKQIKFGSKLKPGDDYNLKIAYELILSLELSLAEAKRNTTERVGKKGYSKNFIVQLTTLLTWVKENLDKQVLVVVLE